MLKATRHAREPKRSARSKIKTTVEIPPENLRVLAGIQEWKQERVTEEQRQAWAETRKSMNESRTVFP